jgi:hypothetical protein
LNGKLLKTVVTNSQNTSGDFRRWRVWAARGVSIHNHPEPPVNGVFQTDTSGKQISHRQIPDRPTMAGPVTDWPGKWQALTAPTD